MKERGILFSTPMVRALLSGEKTMTRRVVKLRDKTQTFSQFGEHGQPDSDGWPWSCNADGDWYKEHCPYGVVGDRLWVRETWGYCVRALSAKRDEDGPFVYRADGESQFRIDGRWRPSIHMPRWASRLTLTITDVRVQRLQDISIEDAIAEGCPGGKYGHRYAALEQYRALWESLNGAGAWDLNPWVWALTFTAERAG